MKKHKKLKYRSRKSTRFSKISQNNAQFRDDTHVG